MRTRHRSAHGAVITLCWALAALSGCGSESPTPPPPPVETTSVTIAPSTVSLPGPGLTRDVQATVVMSAGPATNPVVVWSSSNSAVATVSGTSVTGTIQSVGAGTATITATSGGRSGSTAVTVSSTVSTYTLTLGTGALTAVQGGPAIAIPVRLTRTNFTQAVALAASGAPAGVTVTITPTTVAGDSATLSVTATAAAVPGTYPILVTATAPSLAAQTVTVTVTVQAAPVSANVTIDLSSCLNGNGWFAVQNGATAPWTRVTGVNGRYSFAATQPIVSIAYSSPVSGDNDTWTSVVQSRPADILTIPVGHFCEQRSPDLTPPKLLTINTLRPTPTANLAVITFGGINSAGAFGVAPFGSPLTGSHDLFAFAGSDRETGSVLIRRGVNVTNLPNGALLSPGIDFSATEAGQLQPVPLTVTGRSTQGTLSVEPFVTLGGSCQTSPLPREDGLPSIFSLVYPFDLFTAEPFRLVGTQGVGVNFSFWLPGQFVRPELSPVPATAAIPPARLLRSGDLLGALYVWQRGGDFDIDSESRSVVATSTSLAGPVALPSQMPQVVPDILPDTTYRRFRFRFQLPSDLTDAAVVRYMGNEAILSVRIPSTVLGGRNVDITTPDFTGLPGWNRLFAPLGTVRFEVRGEQNTRTTPCTPGRTAVSSRFGIS